MAFDSTLLRHTMRLWATGVTVVTAQHDNQMRGMTVSSFTSVTMEPPLILICLQKQTETAQAVLDSGSFAVSMLGEEQREISNLFAGFVELAEDEDRFDRIEVALASTGSPIIKGAMGWIDCKVHATHDGSTHYIFVGEVVAASGESEHNQMPLIYYNRDYRRFV